MKKQLLMLALIATTFAGVSADHYGRRDWGNDDWNAPKKASRGKTYGLATVAGVAGGMLCVKNKGNLIELGLGALIGAFTVNGYAVIVRETADPVIVNEFIGLLIKHGSAAAIALITGNAVWQSTFKPKA